MHLNVIFVGCTSGYGYTYSAINTKTEFMVLGLKNQGVNCTIINSVVGIEEVCNRTLSSVKNVCTVISYPKKGRQLISWLRNIKELQFDLRDLYQPCCKNIIILEAPDYHIYRLYCYYARKYNYKIVTIAHEWSPTIRSIHFLRRPFSNLYTKTFGNYVDGILPISEYIIKKIKHFNRPHLKVPVLASFEELPNSHSKSGHYFLYCVYAAYKRVIIPIIEAHAQYRKLHEKSYVLILVLGGDDMQVKIIVDYVKYRGYDNDVIIRRNVPYDELIELYRNSAGLIIPLDPDSQQDHARFSQKIAEYVSSASPIISCKVGEVDYYFKDKESAIFCEYSKHGFMEAFSWVTSHPFEAMFIGRNGYEVGRKYFDYKVVGKQLAEFLKKI